MLSCFKTAAFSLIATALAEQTFDYDVVESQIVERKLDYAAIAVPAWTQAQSDAAIEANN